MRCEHRGYAIIKTLATTRCICHVLVLWNTEEQDGEVIATISHVYPALFAWNTVVMVGLRGVYVSIANKMVAEADVTRGVRVIQMTFVCGVTNTNTIPWAIGACLSPHTPYLWSLITALPLRTSSYVEVIDRQKMHLTRKYIWYLAPHQIYYQSQVVRIS
jgi:hypothetical protein